MTISTPAWVASDFSEAPDAFGPQPVETLLQQTSPLIVVAHPDDETIGAGAQFPRWPSALFIHVTQGAPRDMRDATAAGFSRRSDYGACRVRELSAAMGAAGFRAGAEIQLDFVDQEVALEMGSVAAVLLRHIRRTRPPVIVTHPYEGGHPDHDSVAFAVDCACRLAEREDGYRPPVIEMTSYHNASGLMQTGRFLDQPDSRVISFRLGPAQQRFKRQLLEYFRSQGKVLEFFNLDWERFRIAPCYNFNQAPHPGTLFYEQYGLGLNGACWRSLAAETRARLGLDLCA